ncbi:MAG: NAD-glutamate dehydrogenase, partial [Minwuiales bacterium]|nr:NAD-glutamate dehydrogenase [Minwuiales bacterium]
MYAKAIEQKTERVEKVISHCRDKLSKQQCPEVEAFIRQYSARAASDDVLQFSVENLYGATLSLWKFTASRQLGAPKVRVYNPRIEEHGWKSPHTVVEIVNDDMPFLVDSVTSALNVDGYHVHLIFHPIYRVQRDDSGKRIKLLDPKSKSKAAGVINESVMHFEIDEQSDPAVLVAIEKRIVEVLADVRVAVTDWPSMLGKIDEALKELTEAPPPLEDDEITEGKALLEWMADHHFTFLGYREYTYDQKKGQDALRVVEDSGLGILRDTTKRVLRRGKSAAEMSPDVQEFMRLPELVIVTKTVSRSTIHRPVHLDYVGIKRFGKNGKVVGERRFVGLFTSSAYNRTPREIPYLRRKIQQTMERSGFEPFSHDGKALMNILETYPRDELFQVSEQELHETASGILGLEERPRIRLFVRRDKFERFNSCLVYVPRERYTTDLRRKFQDILGASFNGRNSAFYTQVSESPLARIHFIVGTDPGKALNPDIAEVEQKLIDAARSWDDDLYDALIERWGEESGNRLWEKYNGAFPTAYKELFNAQMALFDIDKIETLGDDRQVALNFYRLIEDSENVARLKIYHPGDPVALSDCLPMMEHMGLRVIEEHPYEVGTGVGEAMCWIHDFRMVDPSGADLDFAKVKDKFEEAFTKVWLDQMEDDGFNQLVLRAGLGWRQVVVLRAYCKYLRQTGITFSQDYMEDTLAANPSIARHLSDLFVVLFDPADMGDRQKAAKKIVAQIKSALDAVTSLDEDRILRRFLNLVQSTLRTNFFQPAADGDPKTYVSFKLDSQAINELPLPRPFREIFVYSPRVEGVHLRGGRVARGGLRWSDRREDFRT